MSRRERALDRRPDVSELWTDAQGIPEALRSTIERADGFTRTRDLLAASGVRRIVATGNGAAFYAAMALWLASLRSPSERLEVVAVPAGLIAGGWFRWRADDRLLAVSSSGELRDLVDVIEAGAPRPFAAITSTLGSTIGRAADEHALVHVARQGAVTHSQAFCGNVAAALLLWALIARDDALHRAVLGAPDAAGRAIAAAEGWAAAGPPGPERPRAAIAFGGGAGWPAALEVALLLKEVARVPAEGLETREGATSGMYALAPGDLAVSIPTADDPFTGEAEEVCRGTGATVVALPGSDDEEPSLAPITSLPGALLLAADLARRAGHDVDRPAWVSAYERTARRRP
jgi:glucosamine 6-phosphate synthetase-like amidotransferase/phosphosugar isomerase protein